MTVDTKDVDAAFSYLLGRLPNRENPPRFGSIWEVWQTILASPEFKERGRSRKSGIRWPFNQMFISHPARIIYCPIGKNACTYLKRQMVLISGIDYANEIVKSVHVLTDHVRTGAQLWDYEESEAFGFLKSPEYTRIAVLRDPADRLLSAYREKFVFGRNQHGNIRHTFSVVAEAQRRRGLGTTDTDLGISFREFVSVVTTSDPRLLDPHWRRQADYLEGATWDRLFRFTQLDEVTEFLEERSGIPLDRRPVNKTGESAGRDLLGAAELLPAEIEAQGPVSNRSFLEDDLVAAIREYFAEDYRILGMAEETGATV